jgi:hypothetical protein
MSQRDDDKLREDGHQQMKELLDRGNPYAVLRATLMPDHQPVFSNYRPQLWIGQTKESGERVYWDAFWLIHERRLGPGESGTVTIFPLSLPVFALFRGEHVEFYEGHPKTAEGEIVRIRCDGHYDDDQDAAAEPTVG